MIKNKVWYYDSNPATQRTSGKNNINLFFIIGVLKSAEQRFPFPIHHPSTCIVSDIKFSLHHLPSFLIDMQQTDE